MTLEMIRRALAWCTLINIGLLIVWFLFFKFAHDWTYRYHTRWYRLSLEAFDTIHYAGMALFKIFLIIFNLVPYLSLHIVG